jgi:hypothetical protein
VPAVRLEHGALWRGGVRIPLLVGEAHYWRVNPHRWPDVLRSCRRLGLEAVATYVPWQYHETAPSGFDFDGRTEPQRNLRGFLDLLKAEGFHVFIRPGPYIYSEWTNAGVPDRVAALPRISEAYRREARVWMRAVTAALRPYLATCQERFADGGPIVLFQPDNEADLFSHWFEGACGLDGVVPRDGATSGAAGPYFQEFLRSVYTTVGELNDAWGARYSDFAEAQPAAAVTNRFDRGALARARDSWRFQHWATAQIVGWHAREYRALGVDLPMVANYYPGGDVQNWRVLSETAVDLLGIDWYPRNEFVGPLPPPGAAGATGGGGIFGLPPHREHRVFLDSCRMQSAVSAIPFIAELECGVWHGYEGYTGSFSPNHYRLLACSALLAGIKGWNWYMFAGRDNWYFSPINERGDLRPELAEEFLALHRVYKELDPATLEPVERSVAAFLECEQIGTDDLLGSNVVLQAMYDARLDYAVVDAAALAGAEDPPRMLFYAGADWLDVSKQEVLRSYVERGGTVVAFTTYPRADERFAPHNGLDIRPPDRVLSRLGKKVEIAVGAGDGPPRIGAAEGPVGVWDRIPDGATPMVGTQVAGRQQAIENADVWMRNSIGKRWTVGYCQNRGRGRLMVIGMPPSADLARAAAEPQAVEVRTAGVQAAVLRRQNSPRDRFLILANLNQLPAVVEVDFSDSPGPTVARDLFTGEERALDGRRLTVPIGRASGGAWALTPVR